MKRWHTHAIGVLDKGWLERVGKNARYLFIHLYRALYYVFKNKNRAGYIYILSLKVLLLFATKKQTSSL